MVPLYTGEVRPEGIELTFFADSGPHIDLYKKMFAGEFDASEMSSSEYLRRTSAGDRTFIAIPAFPSRVFRHGMICINRNAGIDSPKDLEGKRVGVPAFGMTAALWIRGLLQREYDVDLRSIQWVEDLDFGVGAGSQSERLAKTFRIERNSSGKPLETLLDEGVIDAFIGADIPEALRTSPNARRLFPNYKELEQDFYRRTKIFPIMHTVVIRREIYNTHPFVAKALFDALSRSKEIARERMRYMGTLRAMLPWMIAEIEENDALFGGDPFAYGLEPNRHVLETALGYLEDQAMLDSPVNLDTAFAEVR
jgi:4,5-dihydroxyphthalate decarboxylase